LLSVHSRAVPSARSCGEAGKDLPTESTFSTRVGGPLRDGVVARESVIRGLGAIVPIWTGRWSPCPAPPLSAAMPLITTPIAHSFGRRFRVRKTRITRKKAVGGWQAGGKSARAVRRSLSRETSVTSDTITAIGVFIVFTWRYNNNIVIIFVFIYRDVFMLLRLSTVFVMSYFLLEYFACTSRFSMSNSEDAQELRGCVVYIFSYPFSNCFYFW